jgi:SPP1 gp7 family putative phage head morphogenesis protein
MATKKKKIKTKKRQPLLKRAAQPLSIERAYSRQLITIVRNFGLLIPKIIKRLEDEEKELKAQASIKLDAKKDTPWRNATAVKRSLSGIKVELDTVVKKARPNLIAQMIGKQAFDFAIDATDTQIKGVMTITKTELIANKELKPFIKENVNLIKTIPTKFFGQIENTVNDMWTNGRSTADIKDALWERYDITERRAKVIARDQIGKINQQITEKRHRELKITKYRWSTSQDERVRGNPSGLYPDAKYSHFDREGQIFSYDDPPEDGHAGYAIQCRCIAIPIIPELDDDE